MSITSRNETTSATRLGSNGLDSSDECFDVPFHINCRRCFHMHNHVLLRVHKDPKQFTKFKCHNCQHLLAGIGRSETQSSFGSTETQPLEAGYARPSRPSNLHICTNAVQPNGRLSDVENADPTILPSPSGLMHPGPNLSPHQGSHVGATRVTSHASVRNDASPGEASGSTTQSLPKSRWRIFLKLEQGKSHFLKKSKKMKLFGFRFWKRSAPSPTSGGTISDPVLPSDIPSDIRDFQPRPIKSDRSVPPLVDDHSSHPPPEPERRPSSIEDQLQDTAHSSNPPPEPERRPSSIEDQLQDKALKNERLRRRRRDATLRWEYHCGASCACMRRRSFRRDAGTQSPSTSRRSTRAPLQFTADAITENTYPDTPNILDFIYTPPDLPHPRGPLDPIVPETSTETSTMSNTRLSQASTVGSVSEA